MSCLPRLAVGPVHRGHDCRAVQWALLDLFDRLGLRVQSFLSRACLQEMEASTAITGAAPRHLDTWLMTAETCRERFLRAARQSDLAVVEGSFAEESPDVQPDEAIGGRLATLCQWLGLPRLGIVDMPNLVGCAAGARRPRGRCVADRSRLLPPRFLSLADDSRIAVGNSGARRPGGELRVADGNRRIRGGASAAAPSCAGSLASRFSDMPGRNGCSPWPKRRRGRRPQRGAAPRPMRRGTVPGPAGKSRRT